jgi:hypothetical protein
MTQRNLRTERERITTKERGRIKREGRERIMTKKMNKTKKPKRMTMIRVKDHPIGLLTSPK